MVLFQFIMDSIIVQLPIHWALGGIATGGKSMSVTSATEMVFT